MKLNHDNVRELLLNLEENLPLNDSLQLDPSNTDPETLYSALKLIEAGFIEGNQIKFIDGDFMILIHSITWNGHEFLDNIRPKTTWEKTKSLAKTIGGSSLPMLGKIASKVSADMINKQLGM